MSVNLIPDDIDHKTAAFIFRGIATAIEMERKINWSHYSELERDRVEEFARVLRQYADELITAMTA